MIYKRLHRLAAVLLFVPVFAYAQTIERPAKDVEPGDKVAYNWTLNNKKMVLEFDFTEISADKIIGVQHVDGKQYPYTLARSDLTLLSSMCFSNGQSCTFAPGAKGLDFPLQKGKKWESTFTVSGKTFTSDVESKYKVEKFEKVKTPAGVFEAVRISHKGKIAGRDLHGNNFSGSEKGEYWMALVNGKIIMVKGEYRNSFKERYALELATVSLK